MLVVYLTLTRNWLPSSNVNTFVFEEFGYTCSVSVSVSDNVNSSVGVEVDEAKGVVSLYTETNN